MATTSTNPAYRGRIELDAPTLAVHVYTVGDHLGSMLSRELSGLPGDATYMVENLGRIEYRDIIDVEVNGRGYNVYVDTWRAVGDDGRTVPDVGAGRVEVRRDRYGTHPTYATVYRSPIGPFSCVDLAALELRMAQAGEAIATDAARYMAVAP